MTTSLGPSMSDRENGFLTSKSYNATFVQHKNSPYDFSCVILWYMHLKKKDNHVHSNVNIGS